MGISLVVYLVTDRELTAFERDPASVGPWLRQVATTPPVRAASLLEYWRGLHGTLTAAERNRLPWSALTEGELSFPDAGDLGAHACRAAMTKAFAALLAPITTRELEEQIALDVAALAVRTGRPQLLTAPQQAAAAAELAGYLRKLQRVVEEAAAEGAGLLFVRWEDR